MVWVTGGVLQRSFSELHWLSTGTGSKGRFPSLFTAFSYCLFAYWCGLEWRCWTEMLIPGLCPTSVIFPQVISLGSKKPMELCFFRDRWVRLPAEKERLPVCFFFLFFDSLGKKNAFIGEPFKNNHQSPYLSLFLSPRADLIKSSFKIYSLLL